jgi:hypothetical protein
MAIPFEMGGVRRIPELCKTEQSAAPQSSSRGAQQSGAAEAAGALARQAAAPSGDVGHDLNGAGEARTALDVEGLFGRDLDEIVDATIRLSRAQRQTGRRGAGAWRRSLPAPVERLWRRKSKSAGSRDE